MNNKKKCWFVSQGKVIINNLFMGGVGATYSTPSLLITLFNGLLESDIENFSVDGLNNISCKISKSFTGKIAILSSNNSFTYFIDKDGYLSSAQTNSFRYNNNLKQVYLPNFTGVIGDGGGNGGWGYNGFDRYLFLPKVSEILNTAFDNLTSLKVIYTPLLNYIYVQNASRQSTANLTSLNRWYMPLCLKMDWYYLGTSCLANIKAGCTLYVHPALETNQKSYKLVSIGVIPLGASITINGLTYTSVSVKTNNSEFVLGANSSQTTGLIAASVNADTRIGILGDVSAYNVNSLCFISNQIGIDGDAVTISTNDSSAFVFSGGNFEGGGLVNGAIKYARDTRGCVIKYVNDFTTPNTVNNLSASNITTTTVDLNFTAPAPNINGTDGYEVWVDDGVTLWHSLLPFDEILVSGATLSGLVSGTNYKIRIKTFDGFYNLSEFSNTITITTL